MLRVGSGWLLSGVGTSSSRLCLLPYHQSAVASNAAAASLRTLIGQSTSSYFSHQNASPLCVYSRHFAVSRAPSSPSSPSSSSRGRGGRGGRRGGSSVGRGGGRQFQKFARPAAARDPNEINIDDISDEDIPSDFDDLTMTMPGDTDDSDAREYAESKGIPVPPRTIKPASDADTTATPSSMAQLALADALRASKLAIEDGKRKKKATADELDAMIVIDDSRGDALDITDTKDDLDVKNLLRGLAAEVVVPHGPAVDDDIELRQQPSSLEDWFAHRPVSVSNYNKLLRVHAAKHDIDAGWKAFGHMKAAGLVPNLLTFNALITLCGSHPTSNAAENARNADRALSILNDDIKSVELLPDAYTYGSLISTLGRLGDHIRSFELLPRMISQGIVPNTAIYTGLISTCFKCGLYDKANKTFEEMSGHGIQPNLLTYNCMIHVAALQGEVERAISFLQMAKTERMKPNYSTYHGVLYACTRREDYYKDAFVYFTEMVKDGLLPTAETFNILLYGAGRKRDLETGLNLIREMRKYGVAHNQRTLTSWIQVIRSTMRLQNVHVDTQIMNQKARMRLAEEALGQIEAKNMPITSHTLNAIVGTYATSMWVNTTINRMTDLFKKYNFSPDYHTYTILMTMFCRHRAIDRALSLLQEIKDKNIKPDQRMYETILFACQKRRDRPTGSKILAEMRAADMTPPQKYVDIFDELKWDPENPPAEVTPLGATKAILGRKGAQRAARNRQWDPRIDYPRGIEDDYQPDHSEWTKDVGVRKPRPKSKSEMARDEDREYQQSMNRTAKQDLFGEAQNTEGTWEQRLIGRGDGNDLAEYRPASSLASKTVAGVPRLDMRGKSRHRLDVRAGGSLMKPQRTEDTYEAERGLRLRPQYEVNEGQRPRVGRYGGELPKRSPTAPTGRLNIQRTKHGNRKHKK